MPLHNWCTCFSDALALFLCATGFITATGPGWFKHSTLAVYCLLFDLWTESWCIHRVTVVSSFPFDTVGLNWCEPRLEKSKHYQLISLESSVHLCHSYLAMLCNQLNGILVHLVTRYTWNPQNVIQTRDVIYRSCQSVQLGQFCVTWDPWYHRSQCCECLTR